MVVCVNTAALLGLEVIPAVVEVDVANGLPGLHIVGLPDKSVDESRERVRAAIRSSGGTLPARRITVNLAPADLRKEGPAFDLPVAIGILAATEQIPPPSNAIFLGELSLGSAVKPVKGILAVAASARRRGISELFVPAANAAEAALVEGLTVYPVTDLTGLIDHLKGERPLVRKRPRRPDESGADASYDLAQIRGQAQAKRALEIAAAGGHNLLMTGPPGTGKTLLARALAGLLPPLTWTETLEVSAIYSVAGLLSAGRPVLTGRPFRNPHHSISMAGLVGGGTWPRPGELSLAHRGVLFLDELPQFPRHVLEALRTPLEDRFVRISRAQHTLQFPSACMLVGSLNPCPCGFADDPAKSCSCSPLAIEQYRKRLSGPMRDRFDLTAAVPRLSYETIRAPAAEPSAAVRRRVMTARQHQTERLGPAGTNAAMSIKDLERLAAPATEAAQLLREAVDRWQLSVRGYHRVLRVARTIADLAGEEEVGETAVAEALQYRESAAETAVTT
jgi:magnesium chelatase family protein